MGRTIVFELEPPIYLLKSTPESLKSKGPSLIKLVTGTILGTLFFKLLK